MFTPKRLWLSNWTFTCDESKRLPNLGSFFCGVRCKLAWCEGDARMAMVVLSWISVNFMCIEALYTRELPIYTCVVSGYTWNLPVFLCVLVIFSCKLAICTINLPIFLCISLKYSCKVSPFTRMATLSVCIQASYFNVSSTYKEMYYHYWGCFVLI